MRQTTLTSKQNRVLYIKRPSTGSKFEEYKNEYNFVRGLEQIGWLNSDSKCNCWVKLSKISNDS